MIAPARKHHGTGGIDLRITVLMFANDILDAIEKVLVIESSLIITGDNQGTLQILRNEASQLFAVSKNIILKVVDLCLRLRHLRVHKGRGHECTRKGSSVQHTVGSERKHFVVIDARNPVDFVSDILDIVQRFEIEDVPCFY